MGKRSKQQCCALEGIRSTGKFDQDLALLCKALAHPARVQILQMLMRKGVCISGDLAEAVNLAPSTASEHLRILKTSGFVQGTIDGPRRCYCINKSAVKYFQDLIRKF